MSKRVLVLGATGMLGHVLLRYLATRPEYEVHGTARSTRGLSEIFPPEQVARFRQGGVDALNFDSVMRALASFQPDIVINCIGLIKQVPIASDPLYAITVNAQLPHRLSLVSRTAGARMIHVSTDCVFDGQKGNYREDDCSTADDLYGKTKYLGEVNYPHCVTLRTSIIGHELKGGYGLVEWFLAQQGRVRGYTKAIYSGFTTIELARILADHVLPNNKLSGTYHVSSTNISKYDLLKLVAKRYQKRIEIEPSDSLVLDRSLNSSRFREITGYSPPAWADLVDKMYEDFNCNREWYRR